MFSKYESKSHLYVESEIQVKYFYHRYLRKGFSILKLQDTIA